MPKRRFKFSVPALNGAPLPPQGKQVDYRDTLEPGLLLRVSYGGSKTFIADARVKQPDGQWKRRPKTLGRYDPPHGLSLADARDACRAWRGRNTGGTDVIAAGRRAAVEHDAAPTVGHAIKRYLAEHVPALSARTQYQSTSLLIGSKRNRELGVGPPTILSAFGDTKLRDLRSKDVNLFLDAIVARGAGYNANRTHEVLNHMLKWAARKPIDESVEHSVASLWERFKQTPRKRWLADSEIKKILGVLDSAVPTDTAQIYRLLLVTGQRQNEVLTMRWDELDYEKSEWSIPPEKTKSHRQQIVPMSFLFRQILEHRDRSDGFIFPSSGYRGRSSKSGCLTRSSLSHTHADVVAAAGVEHFRFHDLRRTVATHLGELGVDEHCVSRVLNHAPKGVTGVHYNQYSYRDEKQRALEAWSYKLMWLTGQVPPAALISTLHEMGFGKPWRARPWNLEQWEQDAGTVVPLRTGASS
jgi:integrase